MRFRAELTDYSTFSKLIQSLSPLAKTAVLKLTREKIHLICRAPGEGVQVWSHINVASVFDPDEFKLESNSNNEIYLEISTEAFSRALKSAAGASRCQIKLAKKGGTGPNGSGAGSRPVLALSFSSKSSNGRLLEITQDVGVKVLKLSDVESMKEPLCPAPEVSIRLPSLTILKTVSDRLKTISPVIQISANNRGEFRLRAESDSANVQTEWRGLKNPQPEADEEAEPVEPDEFFDVTVDAKSLLKFLGSYTIAQTTIACVCAGHCAIFYVYIGDHPSRGGILTFFIPSVDLGE